MTAKILIVDDEPSNLDTMEAFLVGEGYELHFAANGLVALEKARNVRPDLILLDVMMPELDGFAVTRRIRQDPAVRSMPIILVTALEDSQSRLEGLQAGADDFLTKPCRREEIRARVRTVVQLNRFRTIAEQRERFGRLFDLSPDGIVLVDHDGTIIASNIQASTYRLGGTLFENLQPEAAATLRGMLVGGCMIHQTDAQEVTLETTKGSRVMHVRASAVPEGDDCLVLLVFDDITAEVQAREALEKMNAELEEQVRARTSQLEEANGLLMSYANFVSHDLRSPLAVVKGYLSLVTEGLIPVNAEAAPAIKQAYGGAVIMQELIENILQLAQQEHGRSSEDMAWSTDPTPVVRRLARLMKEVFPNVEAEMVVADLPLVGVSTVLVDRVFYNLLANAIKYSARAEKPRVEVGVLPDSDLPVIYVRDNGVGFDSRDADKLFQEFSRLDTAQTADGLGLGLSLVARLLRAHGGRIWAESSVGAGATFYVEFPKAAAVGPDGLPVAASADAEEALC